MMERGGVVVVFQGEVGIRDSSGMGVQTCALPIFATRHAINRAFVRHAKPLVSGAAMRFDAQLMVFDLRQETSPCYACLFRSEERRVGKEGRSRWSPYH